MLAVGMEYDGAMGQETGNKKVVAFRTLAHSFRTYIENMQILINEISFHRSEPLLARPTAMK